MWPKEPLPGRGSKLAGSPGPSGLVAERWQVAKGRAAALRPPGWETPQAPSPTLEGARRSGEATQFPGVSHGLGAGHRGGAGSALPKPARGRLRAGSRTAGQPGSVRAAQESERFLISEQRTLQLDWAPDFAFRRQANLSSAARQKAANILFYHQFFLNKNIALYYPLHYIKGHNLKIQDTFKLNKLDLIG